MGALVGLLFGIGVLLVWRSGPRRPVPVRREPRPGLRELLAQAGYPTLTPRQVQLTCFATATVVFVLVYAVSHTVAIALSFGLFAGYSPVALLRVRKRQRQADLRALWPDIVDNLVSAVRAGMSLPEAVGQLGQRGPEQLRPAFKRFADDYRATGRFSECLDTLKMTLADPVADRIVESLRLAREVGGTDLGRLLRTLSQFLREDARTRAELEARQGWTVNAARLALAAPWAVLALLALRPEAVAAYDSAAGMLLLLVGGLVSIAAYRLMLRVARLPEEERVLR